MDAANERMAGMTEAEWNDAKPWRRPSSSSWCRRRRRATRQAKRLGSCAPCTLAGCKCTGARGLFSSGPCRPGRGLRGDPRFTAYYDGSVGEGATAFLRDALVAWCAEQ